MFKKYENSKNFIQYVQIRDSGELFTMYKCIHNHINLRTAKRAV